MCGAHRSRRLPGSAMSWATLPPGCLSIFMHSVAPTTTDIYKLASSATNSMRWTWESVPYLKCFCYIVLHQCHPRVIWWQKTSGHCQPHYIMQTCSGQPSSNVSLSIQGVSLQWKQQPMLSTVCVELLIANR